MEFNTSMALMPSNYFQAVYPKRNIVLHHTVSSSARSALTWWKTTPERVATAFVIDKDGTIHQAFDPKYWAYHLGLKTNRNTELNRCSIGIEIVNEGPIQQINGKPYWNFGPANRGSAYTGEIVETPKWRGFTQWAKYTDEQYEAVGNLIWYLLIKFKLPASIYTGTDLNGIAPDIATIYSHRNVRLDKTDLSPAFDMLRIENRLKAFKS